MKTLKSLILAVMIISMLGCSGDDDGSNGGTFSASVVGTWEVVDIDADGTVSTIIDGNNIVVPVVGTPSNIDYTVIFNEDNTVGAIGSFDLELTASFLGEVITENLNDISPVGIGTYSLSGTNLTIQTTEGTRLLVIEELSDELLTVLTTEVYETTESGLDLTTELSLRFYFERQ